MADPKVTLNVAELIRISNAVNREVCAPLAEKVASAARDAHPWAAKMVHTVSDVRSSVTDFAHQWVTVPTVLESRTGVLARTMRSL